jgi:hypothetical protein
LAARAAFRALAISDIELSAFFSSAFFSPSSNSKPFLSICYISTSSCLVLVSISTRRRKWLMSSKACWA